MNFNTQKLLWSELSRAPEGAGIYAWYYSPEITEYDIDAAVKQIRALAPSDAKAANSYVEGFLENFIFRHFSEDPFKIYLKGQLKPRYEGELLHKPTLSGSLIERLVDDPDRLFTIKHVLESSAPFFASPIYIGMSDTLLTRLSKHKKLILKYRAESAENRVLAEGEDRDQSFAKQIAQRNLAPARLFVITMEIEGDNRQYVDLENILNRLHYPLLGRN